MRNKILANSSVTFILDIENNSSIKIRFFNYLIEENEGKKLRLSFVSFSRYRSTELISKNFRSIQVLAAEQEEIVSSFEQPSRWLWNNRELVSDAQLLCRPSYQNLTTKYWFNSTWTWYGNIENFIM